MRVAMLGSGFIARFYASSLHAQRRKDQITAVYSRNKEKASQFAADYGVQHVADSLEAAVAHPEVDVVLIALPNNLHLAAVEACAKAKKNVICTKPLGRTGAEAIQMLRMVEEAGIFGGYLEDLCYTPKFLKALSGVEQGSIGKVLWTKSRETHPGPHSDWFWDKEQSGGGAIIDLGCHCVEIGRSFIGKDIRPLEVMCWADTQVHPIEAEDHAIGLIKYANGAISQFEVSWAFRGGLDLRDEVMGTEGTIWINNFLRTGIEMFSMQPGGYIAEKTEVDKGWVFPLADEVHDLGYSNMFTDMFDSIERQREPRENFYDGYVVNAILDAAYLSAKSKLWEPVKLEVWRGKEDMGKDSHLKDYDAEYYFVKEEVTHYGQRKLILKNKETGKFTERIL